MDMDSENAELRALATYFAGVGGTFWVAEQDELLVGMIGTRPADAGAWEICKVYVAQSARGAGLADTLMTTAESHAKAHGAMSLKLWTDTRFDRAHRFYERHGYIREGGIRAVGDLSNSLEFGYAKPLVGLVIRRLDIAAAESTSRSLARILVDCVDAGASVSFLPPLPLADAHAFYRACATDIARGTRVLLAAWRDGQLAGSVMLDLAVPQNQSHRAEVQKLLIVPALRRSGVARALMLAIESEARSRGRSLLVLDTRQGDSAEGLYRSAGWTESGRIPGYSRNVDGSLDGTVFFYKMIATA